MTAVREALLAQARATGGTPCSGKATLEDCFTDEPGIGLMLWFNDATGSTRVLREVTK